LLATARACGDITDDEWFAGMAAIFDEAYVGAKNPRAQSGFGGNEERWEIGRRPIASMIDAPGAFFDIGCANGYLLECLVRWADHEIEPYGLDIAPAVVALARRRLPEWRERFFVGNALTWEPPARFDFVRTELLYVPEQLQRRLVDRLLEHVVQPQGRLIICGYGSPRSDLAVHPVRRLVGDHGFEPEAEVTVDAPEGGGAIAEIVALRRT
jgi:SAM-dependent methyltransferase